MIGIVRFLVLSYHNEFSFEFWPLGQHNGGLHIRT
jgi:hypothetical protein